MEKPVIEGLPGMLVVAGLGTPIKRAFVAATVVGLAAYALKQPGISFEEDTDDNKQVRPFKLVSRAPTATYYHFLGVPLGAGVVTYLFT